MDWEGYGPEGQTWIPRQNILDDSLLCSFYILTNPAGRTEAPIEGEVTILYFILTYATHIHRNGRLYLHVRLCVVFRCLGVCCAQVCFLELFECVLCSGALCCV